MKADKASESIQYDLCVIGSGPAGIILALEYAQLNPDKKVALVEFGSRNQEGKNSLDDSIVVENKINHHDPYECTNRGLGGTGRTWGGRCVMFDDVDFIDRPIVNNGCTWDISLLQDVKQYTQKNSIYFECGSDVFDLDQIDGADKKRIADGFRQAHITDSRLERWSMPTRFGARYENDIDASENIILFESYEAIGLDEPDSNGDVNHVTFKHTGSGELLKLKANSIAIAAGTQETTRLLLKNLQIFNRLGFVPDALGKYYQGHVSGKIASVQFFGKPENTDYGFHQEKDGVYVRRRFQFDSEFLKKKNLLNTAIWLDNPLYHDPAHKSGAMSFMYMAMITPILGKKLAPPAIKHSVTKGKVNGLGKHFMNILKDFPFSFTVPFSIFFKRYIPKRKLPGVFLYNRQNRYALHYHAEQVPDAKNRMYLDKDGHTLKIDYELMEADIESIIECHKELDSYLQETKCGKLDYWYDEKELKAAVKANSKDGIHQSGTTRIATSPELGVVDYDLKVFGTRNLYVCSCSVFPTSGQANPTYFIGAFAIRLAHHLTKNNAVR